MRYFSFRTFLILRNLLRNSWQFIINFFGFLEIKIQILFNNHHTKNGNFLSKRRKFIGPVWLMEIRGFALWYKRVLINVRTNKFQLRLSVEVLKKITNLYKLAKSLLNLFKKSSNPQNLKSLKPLNVSIKNSEFRNYLFWSKNFKKYLIRGYGNQMINLNLPQ